MRNARRSALLGLVLLLGSACATAPSIQPAEPGAPPARSTVPTAGAPRELDAAPPEIDPAELVLKRMETVRAALIAGGSQSGDLVSEARELTDKVPDHYYAWQLLGLAILRNGQKVLAAEAFRKAVDLRPDDPVSRGALASLAMEWGDLESAEEHLTAAYRSAPDLPAANSLAYVMIRKGRLDTAQALLESTRKVAPEDQTASNNLAVVLDAMGHTAWALSLLAGPAEKDARILSTKAMLELKEGLLDEAAHNLDASLSMQKSADALLLTGLLHLQRGRLADAVSSLREFVADNPGRPEGYVNLGLALRRLGRFSEAQTTYQEGLRKAASPELHLNLGTLLELYRGDSAAALDNYRAFVQTKGAGTQRVQGWIDYLSAQPEDAKHPDEGNLP